jgi:hypothetical protein
LVSAVVSGHLREWQPCCRASPAIDGDGQTDETESAHIGRERDADTCRLMFMDSPPPGISISPYDRHFAYRLAVVGQMVLVLALSGCGSSTGAAVDGPVMRHPERSNSQAGMDAEVRGVLQLDGRCLYVSLEEVGERYPIVWPAGTRWDADNQAVIAPGGQSMAIGDEVYGGGGYLYVDDIERIAGPEASALATECVDNTYGEIAVVNNADTAIGPAQP